MNLLLWSTATFVFCILCAAETETAARLSEKALTLEATENETSATVSTEESPLIQLEFSTEYTNHFDNKEKHEKDNKSVDNDGKQKILDNSTSNSTDSNLNTTKSDDKEKLGCFLWPEVQIVDRYEPAPLVEIETVPVRIVEQVPVYYPVKVPVAVEYKEYDYPSYPKNPCYEDDCNHSGYYRQRSYDYE